MHVTIIGAGTTGLLLAQGLQQAGIKATVYERETPDMYISRPREWGMSLHWGAESMHRLLPPELRARIKETWSDPSTSDGGLYELALYAGHTGELLGKTPDQSMRVARRKMRKLFSENIHILYGKHVTSIVKQDDTVTATFSDGTSVTSDLVIGCDGAKSTVRSLLLGNERATAKHLDLTMLNFTCQFDFETSKMIRKQNRFAFNSYHPADRMFWVSIMNVDPADDPFNCSYQLVVSWKGAPRAEDLPTQQARTAYLKSLATEYAEPWKTIISNIPGDIKFGTDKVTVWNPSSWSAAPLAGSVTLAGDAAHPIPPHRGQGLNMGLRDADRLTAELTGVKSVADIAAAVARYEEEMIERAQREFVLSMEAADIAHDFERINEHPLLKIGVANTSKQEKS